MATVIESKEDFVHAMHRKGAGWVDFNWGFEGTPPDRKDAWGVSHILEKRDREHRQDPRNPDGKTTAMVLPTIIAKGQVVKGKGTARESIEYNGWLVTLQKEPNGRWLLTGFQKGKGPSR